MALAPCWDDSECEVCCHNGFVYKRRRQQHHSSLARISPADAEAECLKEHRARKKQRLLALRDNYKAEIDQWELLSASLNSLIVPPQNDSPEAGTSSIASSQHSHSSLSKADELLIELEAQEAFLRKLSDLCDCAESFCEAQEEQFMQSLLDLPIWGSSKTLMRSLCD